MSAVALLLRIPRHHWTEDAACRIGAPVDPEWWWPDSSPGSTDDTTAGRALHICQTHCDVRAECRAEALANPPRHPVVLGGVRYVTAKPSGTKPALYGATPHPFGCPYCPAGGAAIDDRRPPLALSNPSGVTRCPA